MLLKSLVSSISKVTQDLGNTVSTQSALSSGGSLQLSLTLSATVNSVVNNITSTSSTIKTIIDGLTDNLHSTPLETVTDLLGGLTGGISTGDNPLSAITAPLQTGIDVLQGVESLKTDVINSAIDTLADAGISILPQAEHQISTLANLGTLTFETSRDTVNGTLDAVSAVVDLNPQGVSNALTGVVGTLVENGSTATHLLSGLSGGLEGNPLEVVTDLVGGFTGGANTNPLETVTDLLGGLTGGISTGDNPLSAITAPLQTGIDVLQGVESLKTDVINSAIDTLANAGISILPQAEHQISTLANLGTLTFETSRDTVNGTLDAVSAVVDLNPQGVSNALTGVVGTLVENGSTATHLLSSLSGGLESNPLEVVTDLVGGLTGGANTNPLETVTDLLSGLTGNIDTGLLGNLTGSLHGLIDIGETLAGSGTEIVADTSHALLNAFEVAADSTANLVSSLLDGVTLTTETTNHQLGLVSDLLNNATSSLSNISHTYQTPISVPNVLDQLLENHLSSV